MTSEFGGMMHPRGKNALEGPPVVMVRGVCKQFTKGVPVLQNLNMSVPPGAIYSLLGSSGCGKTVTLSCIVGLRKVDAGHISVFGTRPGLNGQLVGYMPQDTSLYGDFSIAETLSYFGTLSGMPRKEAERETHFLTQLLSLPHSSRRVGTLSGGQRRRVSFACALVAKPKLLILDEPTVGVDPLLREHIWKHLVHLSGTQGTTVLITTHYIDEAKNSSMVGVLRQGRLLVEQDPQRLLQRFNTNSLETVVLQLCRRGSVKPMEEAMLHNIYYEEKYFANRFMPQPELQSKDTIWDSGKRIKALMYKNMTVLFRNLLLFFFAIIMPSVIVSLAKVTYGNDPKHLNFGVVNPEMDNLTHCLHFLDAHTPGECDIENLSCKFLQHLPDNVVNLVTYSTEQDAEAAVHLGDIWGYVQFPEHFSTDFYDRFSNGATADAEVFNRSEIIVRMDETNNFVMNKVQKSLYDGFEHFAMTVLRDCGFDKRLAKFTLNYREPIFGSDDYKFIAFVVPSCTITFLFFFPIVAASIRYINEKKQGTYERSLVAGTKTWEVLVAYCSTEWIVLLLQSLIMNVIIRYYVGLVPLGSYILVGLLCLLSGFMGVSMGFFVGSLCNEEMAAALLIMALFFPNFFLSGVLWPVEGMSVTLQYISYALPCTLAAEASRSLFNRGWDFEHEKVWPGFVSTVAYILLYFGLTVLVQKIKSK